MSAPRFGLGILCWRNLASLAVSLESYERRGLLDLAAERRIVLAEASEDGTALARAYGFEVDAVDHNLGILGGFERLARGLRSELVVLLEDDCPMVAPRAEAERQLALAAAALTANDAAVVRLRSRAFPGAGRRFETMIKTARYHPSDDAGPQARTAATLRRLARPGKSARMTGGLPYALADPWADPAVLAEGEAAVRPSPSLRDTDRALTKRWPARFRIGDDGMLLGSAAVIPWSNQSVALRRSFYLDEIAAYAAAHPRRTRLVGGFPNVERELNGRHWRRSGWWVGLPEGLFAHELCP